MKFAIWMTIGGANTDDSIRRIGWGLHRTGWHHAVTLQARIRESVNKIRERGYSPILILHNPWGVEGGEVMDFDQRLEALKNPSLEKLKDFEPFCEHWIRPLLADDGELIVYIGSVNKDRDMIEREDDPSKYISRVNRSLLAIPDWASIGADTAGGLMPDTPGYHTWAMRRATGQKIYIEPRPKIGAATIGWPIICDGPWWWRSDPDIFEDAARLYVPNSECGDDVIRFVFRHHGNAEKRADWYRRILNDGHVLATTYSLLNEVLNE